MALQFDDVYATTEPNTSEDTPEAQTETITYTRSKKGTGRKALPKSLPYIEQVHDLSDEEKHCACGCALTHIHDEVTEQLDVVPQMTFHVVHIRKKYACKGCEETIRLAKLPKQPIDKAIATPGLLAAASWEEVLLNLRQRGLPMSPKLAVEDGALGFWGALSKIYPETQHQRCWVHKTANVLNKLPKSMQPKVKASLHEIWMASTRDEAYKAFDNTIALYGAKYPKAMDCLAKDKEELLAFYDFPAEHWIHIRTTNPIESAFSTVRLRTHKSRNCGFRETTLAMVYKLMEVAQKRWIPSSAVTF